jgi:hypothetical protein
MLEPRPVQLSSPEVPPSMERIMAPTQLAVPRPAEHRTIDRPFVRTFDPTPAPSFLRRKNAMMMGAGGFALLLAIGLVVFGSRRSASGAGQPTALARGTVDNAALVGGLPTPAPSVQEVAPPDSPKADDVASSTPASSAGAAPAPAAPRRKGKPPKGPGPKRDYGI